MILPLLWTWLRPGFFIPVFFLLPAWLELPAQTSWSETSSSALGGAYVTLEGFSSAALNQACLGPGEQNSICLQHCRPYLLKEIGQSSLSAQFFTGTGTLGFALSTQGIQGLRQSSLWLSYGMKLHPDVHAGMGIHVWNSSLTENWRYHYGISFAAGIRIKVHPSWVLACHVANPASWTSLDRLNLSSGMSLAAGFSYSFLEAGVIFSEIHVKAIYGLSLVQAIKWPFGKGITLSMGVASNPLTFSWGMAIKLKPWSLLFAFQYRSHSGTVPFSSISHVW